MKMLHQLLRPVVMATLFVGAVAGSAHAECNIVIEAATETGNGIVEIPGKNGATAFALSTTNTGTSCSATVGAVALPPNVGISGPGVPVTVTLCQTNQNAQCTNPTTPGPSGSVKLNIAANAQPTFSVFLQASGAIPANSQVCVFFIDTGNNDTSIGSICLPLEDE